MRIIADFETKSGVDLRQVTSHRYATDPEADILCLTWTFKGEEPRIWRPGELFPSDLAEAVRTGATVVFHNAEFDRVIWNTIGVPRYGFPGLNIDQTDCTAARAAAVNMARSLAGIGEALGLAHQKKGGEVLRVPGVSMPRKPTKADPRRWLNRQDDPAVFVQLDTYAKQDIRTTDELDSRIEHLSPFERGIFHANCRVNARGLRVDVPLIHRVLSMLAYEERNHALTLGMMTDGRVTALTSLPAIKRWLREQGLALEDVASLQESARAELLEREELPPGVRELLTLLDAHKASVKKLPAMLATMSPDRRVRGLFRYCGASQTMRFAGQKVQPQNLQRPEKGVKLGELRHELATKGADYLTAVYGSVAQAAGNGIRTFFIPEPGKLYVAMDLSQIELRLLAWLAGDEETLTDLAKGRDVYARQANDLYELGQPLEMFEGDLFKKKFPIERQMGKEVELACGYQLGWEKFQTTVWVKEQLRVSDEFAQKAVRSYRDTHPCQVALWAEMQQAAFEAVLNPGTETKVQGGKIRFKRKGKDHPLLMRLPSKHHLYYWIPKIEKIRHPKFLDHNGEPMLVDQITYKAPNAKGSGASRLNTYGGKLTENAIQAIARQVLCLAFGRLDKLRLPLVLHAHDELVCEVPAKDAKAVHDLMEETMARNPDWLPGCPLAAEGWIGDFYRK